MSHAKIVETMRAYANEASKQGATEVVFNLLAAANAIEDLTEELYEATRALGHHKGDGK